MKDIEKRIESLKKSLGSGGTVRGLRSVAPKYTAEQIERGASAALQAGVLDPETAGVISSLLAIGGAAAVPSAVIRALEGQD
jgi:hypothetical protein